MKLIFRDLTIPLQALKCGPAAVPLISAGVSAVGGIGGSLIQGSYSSSNVSDQLEAQKQENQLNRDWQTAEAEKNRDFQSAQVLQQNQFAREMMGSQFGNQQQLAAQQQGYNLQSMAKQAEYNSPVYQSAELRKAHLNPQVYFGQSASFGGSSALSGGAPSASSGSVPSAPSGSMPGSVGGLSPVGYQPPNLQIGQILKDFADARKSMAETKTEDLMRDPMYKEVMSKVQNQELVNKYQELANFVFNETKNAKVQQAFIELSKAEKDVILADDHHMLNAAEKRYKESMVALNKAAEALNGTQAVLFGLKVDNFDKDFQSELAVRRSEVLKNEASSEHSKALAKEIRTLLPHKENAQILANGLAAIDYNIKDITSQPTIDKAIDEAKRVRNMVEKGEFIGRYLPPDMKVEGNKANPSVYDDFEDGLVSLWRAYRRGVERGQAKVSK